MSNIKITALDEVTSVNDVTTGDFLHIIDSDKTSSTYPTGTNRKIKVSTLANGIAKFMQTIPTAIQNELDKKVSISDFNTAGLKIVPPVVAASVASISSLSSLVPGYQLDEITLAVGDRILLKNQSDATQNGIYVIKSSGAPDRAPDFDSPSEINSAYVLVNNGATLKGSGWSVTSNVMEMGTDPITFTQFSAALTSVNKAMVGLGRVNNTNDAEKPISDLTAAALALKANIASPTFTGTVTSPAFSGSLTGTASGNVKQGGGPDQGTNNIRIGWSSKSENKLRVQVDGTDYKTVWPIDISGNATSATSAGSATTSGKVVATAAVGSTATLVESTMATNDKFRILVGGNSTDGGYVEIATADNGTEPIYVRQYEGGGIAFTTLKRTAALLDGSGNTSFPGTVTAPTFSGALDGNATSATTAGSVTNGVYTDTAQTISGQKKFTNTLIVGSSTVARRAVGDQWDPTNLIYTEGAGTGFYKAFVGVTNRNDTVGTKIVLGKSRGTSVGSNAAVQVNDQIGDISFAGATGTNMQRSCASIEAHVDAAIISGDHVPGRITFSTGWDSNIDSNGIPTPLGGPVERMRITSKGRVGIGTTNPSSTLHVNGTVTATAFSGSFTGGAKAFGSIKWRGAVQTNPSSFLVYSNLYGVSSIAWVRQGVYKITFSTAMANTQYTVVATVAPDVDVTSATYAGNNWFDGAGSNARDSMRGNEATPIIFNKTTSYFYIVIHSPDSNTYENANGFGFVVFSQ